jgi:hypothetical protein
VQRLAESDDVGLPMRLIGLAVVTFSLILAPLVALAQQPPGKTVRIGSLFFVTSPFLDEEFQQGLRELGYVEGRSIAIEYRSAEGKYERLPLLSSPFQATTQAGGARGSPTVASLVARHPNRMATRATLRPKGK